MAVPWGEPTRPADTRVYDIPQPPPPSAQTQPPGWAWDNVGRNGVERTHPPYTIVETPDMKNYFDHQTYPASSDQYHGQPDGPQQR